MHGELQTDDDGKAKCAGTLTPDLTAAEQFLFLLGVPTVVAPEGEEIPETKHTFQVFEDAKGRAIRPRSKHGTLRQHAAWLTEQNKLGAGVFVCVHEMDDSGHRVADKNFKRIRAVVADLDDGLPDTPWPCDPSMIVHTSPGKQHVYWLVGDYMSPDDWVATQRRLIADYKSDPAVKDVVRVMRVPGFFHYKTETPQIVTFEIPGDEPTVYSAATLMRVFPPIRGDKRTRSLCTAIGPIPEPRAKKGVSIDLLPASLTRGASTKRHTLEEVANALASLEADDRAEWVRFGTAIKRDHGDEGMSVWLEWSATSTLFEEADALVRWSGFDVSDTGPDKVTCGTIIHLAKAAGWKPTTTGFDGDIVDIVWPDTIGPPKNNTADPNSAKNVITYLDKKSILPRLNEFDHCVYLLDINKTDTKLNDDGALNLRMMMHGAGLRVGKDLCSDTVMWMAGRAKWHPVRKYLDELVWDRKPRLDAWPHTYCGAEDNEYHQLVGSKWMIAAVRRVRQPGCKFDNILVFEGAQNAGKSSV